MTHWKYWCYVITNDCFRVTALVNFWLKTRLNTKHSISWRMPTELPRFTIEIGIMFQSTLKQRMKMKIEQKEKEKSTRTQHSHYTYTRTHCQHSYLIKWIVKMFDHVAENALHRINLINEWFTEPQKLTNTFHLPLLKRQDFNFHFVSLICWLTSFSFWLFGKWFEWNERAPLFAIHFVWLFTWCDMLLARLGSIVVDARPTHTQYTDRIPLKVTNVAGIWCR